MVMNLVYFIFIFTFFLSTISLDFQLKKKSEEVYGLFKRFHNILKSKLFPHKANTGGNAQKSTQSYYQQQNYQQHYRSETPTDGRWNKHGRPGFQIRPPESETFDSKMSLLARWYEQKLKSRQMVAGGDQTGGSTGAAGDSQFPFVVEKVRASPVVDEYRNKVEFTVGKF